MKKPLIILFLLLAILTDSKAQDKYYQVTTDSTLAFKLAFANFSDNQQLHYTSPGCQIIMYTGITTMVAGAIVVVYGEYYGAFGELINDDMLIGASVILGGLVVFIGGLVCKKVCLGCARNERRKQKKSDKQMLPKEEW